MVSIPPIKNTSPESVFGSLRNLWKTAIAQLNKSSAYTQHAGSPVRLSKSAFFFLSIRKQDISQLESYSWMVGNGEYWVIIGFHRLIIN